MVIYIESVFAFNVLVDYLLLFGAARVAGRTVARRRLLLGAAVGGIYAAVQLFLPKSVVLLLLGLALMGAAAYRGSGRAVKLTLLFFLASCGLAGVVMLLGQSLGSMARLARGVVTADPVSYTHLRAHETKAARRGQGARRRMWSSPIEEKRPACGCCATRATRSVTL